MKIKETRGRKLKHPKLALNKGKSTSFDLEPGLQSSLLNQARRKGQRLRTWKEGDKLFVYRTK